jgi:hypothetical protein
MKQTWKRWEQVASRITGFSVPIFGLSWNPPIPDRTAAERAITDFEGRGLLYADFQWEMPDQCYADAAALREELTEQMKTLSRDAPVFRQLDAIRDPCRLFRNKLRLQGVEQVSDHAKLQDRQKAKYLQALGALRDASGQQIMLLCVQYGVDVAAHLASALPAPNAVSDE